MGVSCRNIRRIGYTEYARILQQLLPEYFFIFAKRPRLEYEYLFLVIAQFFMLDVIELFVHHGCTNNETDGNQELEDDQTAAQPQAFVVWRKLSFQYRHRLEGRQEKCRITSGQQTYSQPDAKH